MTFNKNVIYFNKNNRNYKKMNNGKIIILSLIF
jgi:hypothetical protein